MGVYLPPRGRLQRVAEDDPLPFYYMPVVGPMYRRRLDLAAELLGPGHGSVLEIGYGSGVFLPQLAAQRSRVVAVDRHGCGATVRSLVQREGVDPQLVTGDVCALPFADRSVQSVVCLSVLEHVARPEHAAAEIRRVLSPEGVVVLGYPRVDRLMEVLFRTIGFRGIEAHHVSGPAAIEAAFRRVFVLEARRTWPWGPLSLYYVSRWRVRGDAVPA
jgi:SAM-dependent methyltransferase